MNFINGLHGTVAALLLCVLLYIDEAGVPLPFAPNEALLIVAGLLMAEGAMPAWLFMPLGYISLGAGMTTGYSWARAIGSVRLRAVARRFRAGATYDKAQARLRSATPLSLGITRLLPGVRTYATLVSGAAEIPFRTFATGAFPALAVWMLVLTGMGAAVGKPAEHYLSEFQNLIISGVILLAFVVSAVLAIRRIPSVQPSQGVLVTAPTWERLVLAVALDVGVVATVVAAIDNIIRGVLHAERPQGFYDLIILIASTVIFYVLLARRGPGTTAGEGLFNVSYRSRGSRPMPVADD